jgi:hypothetical protein
VARHVLPPAAPAGCTHRAVATAPLRAREATDDDCGGHGTSYLYQNFPSYGTNAKNDDGTPMHNWWVYLFY